MIAFSINLLHPCLTDFEEKWGKQYPYAAKVWYNNWDGIKTMFGYSPEIRHVIYTTNAIEGFNYGIKKITKTKSSFPSEDFLFKILYLISQDITKKWTMSIPNWSLIFGQFLIKYEDRILKFLNSWFLKLEVYTKLFKNPRKEKLSSFKFFFQNTMSFRGNPCIYYRFNYLYNPLFCLSNDNFWICVTNFYYALHSYFKFLDGHLLINWYSSTM